MKLGIAIHIHSNGSDGYIFCSEKTTMPDEETVAKALGIDFDPQKENLELAWARRTDLATGLNQLFSIAKV